VSPTDTVAAIVGRGTDSAGGAIDSEAVSTVAGSDDGTVSGETADATVESLAVSVVFPAL
jgi:hypothetical protein